MGRMSVNAGGGGDDLDVVTASAGDVLSGKVIVDKDGNPLAGTMPNIGAIDAANSVVMGNGVLYARMRNGAHVTNASSGYPEISMGQFAVASAAGLTAAKLWPGITILGITSSKSNMAGGTYKPGTSQQTISCNGKAMTSDVVISACSLPAAVNLKKGVTYTLPSGESVTGTWEGFSAPDSSYLFYKGSNPGSFTLLDSMLGLDRSGYIHSCYGDCLLWDVENGVVRCYGSNKKSYNLSNYSKIRFMLRGVYSAAQNPSIIINSYFGSDYSKSYENRVFGVQQKLNFSNYFGEAYDVDISSITGIKYIAFNFSTPALTIFAIKSIQLVA